jgi:hypothetical protein
MLSPTGPELGAVRMDILQLFLQISLIIGIGFGLWHFVAPYLHRWFHYMPGVPPHLIVAIEWTNFFFSLLLTGLSVLLFINIRELVAGNHLALQFYSLYCLLWFFRSAITAIKPWSGKYDWIFWLQFGIFTVIFLFSMLPFLFWRKN